MLLIQILILFLPNFTSHSNSCDMNNLNGIVIGVFYEILIVLIYFCFQENLAMS